MKSDEMRITLKAVFEIPQVKKAREIPLYYYKKPIALKSAT